MVVYAYVLGLCILASSRIPRYDLGRQTPAFSGRRGSIIVRGKRNGHEAVSGCSTAHDVGLARGRSWSRPGRRGDERCCGQNQLARLTLLGKPIGQCWVGAMLWWGRKGKEEVGHWATQGKEKGGGGLGGLGFWPMACIRSWNTFLFLNSFIDYKLIWIQTKSSNDSSRNIKSISTQQYKRNLMQWYEMHQTII
jgi:hypothetical protein